MKKELQGIEDLRCPECRAPLKQRRSRNSDPCERVCGGCGRFFDVCGGNTPERLQKEKSA